MLVGAAGTGVLVGTAGGTGVLVGTTGTTGTGVLVGVGGIGVLVGGTGVRVGGIVLVGSGVAVGSGVVGRGEFVGEGVGSIVNVGGTSTSEVGCSAPSVEVGTKAAAVETRVGDASPCDDSVCRSTMKNTTAKRNIRTTASAMITIESVLLITENPYKWGRADDYPTVNRTDLFLHIPSDLEFINPSTKSHEYLSSVHPRFEVRYYPIGVNSQ